MPVSIGFWDDLRTKLEAVRPVTSRKMFGGIGLYCGGPMFAIVDNDRLFFKVDEQTVHEYDKAEAEMWMYDPAVGPIAKYREVPDQIMSQPEKLGEWIDASAEAAIRMDKPKKRK